MKSRGQGDDAPETQPPALSSDGYLRLTLPAFRTMALMHVMSELELEGKHASAGPAGASLASIIGYTEWASRSRPAMSLGWDWRLDTSTGRPRYERIGEVRSNIMLLDSQERDLGGVATETLLCIAVDSLAWQQTVGHYITDRYACHPSRLTVNQTRSFL